MEVKCAILQTMIFEPDLIKHLLGAKIPITVFADRSKLENGPLVDKNDKHNINMVYQQRIGSIYEYGCFHSKLILYEFDDRLRVIISSSNLYHHDWDDMS